jgi:hypothetical protein
MTGYVLVAKEPWCRGLVEKIDTLEREGEDRSFICASGEAAAFALLCSMGVSPGDASSALAQTASCRHIDEAEALFSALIQRASGRKCGVCVPIIDLFSLEQFSYTNIEDLISGRIESGLFENIPPSTVAASAVFGLCPGFSYMGRSFSAGRENISFCLNCLKRLGCKTIILEG